MEYIKFDPASSLKQFVNCYYIWRGESIKPLTVQSPPNAVGAIVFNFADLYQAFQGHSILQPVPRDFVCGVFTSNYQLVLKGDIDIVGIVFYPNAIHNLFQTRMSMLVNNRMELSLLLGELASTTHDRMRNQGDKDRINTLEELILQFLPDAKTRQSIIDDSIEYIDQQSGITQISDVADKFSISKRYMEKQFLVKVGVSPKMFARIKRFTQLSNQVANSREIDWQSLVDKFGLHDQSHLVKEFMKFNNMSPAEYLKNHHEMSRLVKAKKGSR